MSNKRSATAAELETLPRSRRGGQPQPDASPPPSESTHSPTEDSEELSTDVPSKEDSTAPAPRRSSRTVEELEDEVEVLEAVIDRLDDEKHALRTRLNEIEFFKKFDVGDCKKWLANNYEFDRKDTPELLAGIFENYLMQHDAFEPLPHQLLIKNSSRGQAKRDKMVLGRSNLYQRKEKERTQEAETKVKKTQSKTTTQEPNSKGLTDSGSYDHLYIAPQAIEDLHVTKPWTFIVDKWPSLRPTSKTPNVEPLEQIQQEFLEKNACAIWERTHWFPIKPEQGKNAQEALMLSRHHNRRKRRQAVLKERLELLAAELKAKYDKPLLEQSVFGARWVNTIMKRPTLWIPREFESLIYQLQELDDAEPERRYHLS